MGWTHRGNQPFCRSGNFDGFLAAASDPFYRFCRLCTALCKVSKVSLRWTPLVGRGIRWNKLGLAARETPAGLAWPLPRFNLRMY